MATLHVKICGIRSVADAQLAGSAGADAIGLLVGQRHPSGDFLTSSAAAAIVAACPPSVTPVLVTHIEDPAEVHALATAIGIHTLQIHSDMPPAGLAVLRHLGHYRLLKSYHVTSADSLVYGEAYRDVVDGFVLDSLNIATGQVGGTGLTHNWDLSRRIVARYAPLPVILAGGLNPDNVAQAVAQVQPYGVDVNSGVKNASNGKDPGRVLAFVQHAKTPRAFE